MSNSEVSRPQNHDHRITGARVRFVHLSGLLPPDSIWIWASFMSYSTYTKSPDPEFLSQPNLKPSSFVHLTQHIKSPELRANLAAFCNFELQAIKCHWMCFGLTVLVKFSYVGINSGDISCVLVTEIVLHFIIINQPHRP